MGQATATFTPNNFPNAIENTLDDIRIRGTIAISPSTDTYASNGLPVSPSCNLPYSGGTVIDAYFHGTSGYQYYYDPAHGTIRFYLAGVETAGGATTPAAVSGDTIYAEFILRRS